MAYDYVDDDSLRTKLLSARKRRQEIASALSYKQESATNTTPVPAASRTINSSPPQLQIKRSSINPKVKIRTPPTKDLAIATKQLASMVRTGLPLLESLNIIADSIENKTLKYVFRETSIGISKGSTFVENLEKYPQVFNDMYLALASAGEAAGLLPDVLEREASLLESLSKIKGQIRSAMAYPIAIFALTIIVIIIMLVFVIPIFVDIYSSSGTELPALTQILVNGSNALRSPDFLIKTIPPTGLLIFFGLRQSKTQAFIDWRDRFLLTVPIVKDLITKSSLANFSRTLSALNSAGVPILESLQISKRTLGNCVFKAIAERMYLGIQVGQPIYQILVKEKQIPPMFSAMFRIGEETGELSEMVNKLADFYEEEVSSAVKALTSVLEPLMIVFVASVVAIILVAMYLPMFNMMNTVK